MPFNPFLLVDFNGISFIFWIYFIDLVFSHLSDLHLTQSSSFMVFTEIDNILIVEMIIIIIIIYYYSWYYYEYVLVVLIVIVVAIFIHTHVAMIHPKTGPFRENDICALIHNKVWYNSYLLFGTQKWEIKWNHAHQCALSRFQMSVKIHMCLQSQALRLIIWDPRETGGHRTFLSPTFVIFQ